MAQQLAHLPRGLRNNNPLNLRISNVNWKGKRPAQENTDGAFEQFDTLTNGIRAGLLNIRTYINKYCCATPASIIRRWAPASDGNNEDAYINAACRYANLKPSSLIVFQNKKQVCALVYGMVCVECGRAVDINKIYEAYDAI